MFVVILDVFFTTKKNVGKLLAATSHNSNPDIYKRSGVYGLTCQTCQRLYIGQTERTLRIRFKEHNQDYKKHAKKSYFAKDLL
jgi:hypothetical protein